MKKAIFLIFIAIMLFTIVACNTNNGGNSSTKNIGSQSEPNSQDTLNQAEQSHESTEKINSETVLTEFTVEVYPVVGSKEPINDPFVTFTLEIPTD